MWSLSSCPGFSSSALVTRRLNPGTAREVPRCETFFHTQYRYIILVLASLVAQLVKNPPAMQETWVQPLGWEDLLERGKAPHSSILAWRIP